MVVIVMKSQKELQKCVIKRRLKFNDCKNYLVNNESILVSPQKFKG